jgi:hypothetical protein
MSTNIEQEVNSLVAELAEADSDVIERVGSAYAFEIETDSGPMQLLFKLDNGNPARPSIVALYLGGQLATDVPPDLAKTFLRGLLEQAPWLILNE